MPVAIAAEPSTKTISGLEGIIEGLPPEERELVKRLYWVKTTVGRQRLPETMKDWAEKQFETSVDALEFQIIVRTRNLWTGEEALFNELRASRPFTAHHCSEPVMEQILRTDDCFFCNPEEKTPEDLSYGRVRGKECLTASNVAKYDAHHGLIIPSNHNPLEFGAEKMHDCLEVALQWFRQEYVASRDAACPYLAGNILWRAGASINHQHLQLTMSTGGNYPAVERQKSSGDAYSQCGSNGRNYFDDLFRAHEALGLGFSKHGSRIIAELTPKKEKGAMIIRWMPTWDEFPDIADSVDFVIQSYLRMGVQSFNMSFYLPSMPQDNGWCRFPNIVRFVDRGSLAKNIADLGGMELAEIPVISTDPYKLMNELVRDN